MSINTSNYVVKSTTPNVPRISVNIMADSSAAVDSAIEAYCIDAETYANSFTTIVDKRDYVANRFMKDLCAQSSAEGMTTSGINYIDNKITLHVKANELYDKAVNGKYLNSVANVTAIANSFNSLYDTFYTESGVCVLNTEDTYYLPEEAYDAKVYVNANAIAEVVSANTNFINSVPNADGTDKTYTSYKMSGAVVSPDFEISHISNFPITSGVTSSVWVVNSSIESAVPFAYTTDVELTSATTWTSI